MTFIKNTLHNVQQFTFYWHGILFPKREFLHPKKIKCRQKIQSESTKNRLGGFTKSTSLTNWKNKTLQMCHFKYSIKNMVGRVIHPWARISVALLWGSTGFLLVPAPYSCSYTSEDWTGGSNMETLPPSQRVKARHGYYHIVCIYLVLADLRECLGGKGWLAQSSSLPRKRRLRILSWSSSSILTMPSSPSILRRIPVASRSSPRITFTWREGRK